MRTALALLLASVLVLPAVGASEPPTGVEGRLVLTGMPGVGASATMTLFVDAVHPPEYGQTRQPLEPVAPDWVHVEGGAWMPEEGANHTWTITPQREGAWAVTLPDAVVPGVGTAGVYGFHFAHFRNASVTSDPDGLWSFPAAVEHDLSARRAGEGFAFTYHVEGLHDWMSFGALHIQHAEEEPSGSSKPGEPARASSTQTLRFEDQDQRWLTLDAYWDLEFDHPEGARGVTEPSLDCSIVFVEPRGETLWLLGDTPCDAWEDPGTNATKPPARPLGSGRDADAPGPPPTAALAVLAAVVVLVRRR